MEEKQNILKKNEDKIQLQNKTDGVQATHSYSKDELDAFCEHINFQLQDDPDLKEFLPITEHEKLFDILDDGILLCKLINQAQPGTIDQRAINLKKPMNVFKKTENLNLAISSSKSIGCVVVNIHPQLITEKREHIVLGLVWQVIKAQMIGTIDLKNHPYLIRLKKDDEELEDLLKLPKDELLKRWFNYHLQNAGHNRQITNFDKDLQDGENYTILLNQLCAEKCDKSGLNENENNRAEKIINDAKKLGVPNCVKPSDITKARTKLNQLFCAHIFNLHPGLTAEESELKEAATLIDDDNADDSREERVYAQWINSLGIEDVQINSLIPDLKDGVFLNKVLHHLEPEAIDLKKVSNKTKSRIFKIQNGNLAVETAKKVGAQIVGIGGVDVVDGNRKLVLAILWQLMRKHILDKLGKLKEEDILNWANNRVDEDVRVKNLKDKSLANGKFLFKLCQSIESSIVDWDFVTPGESEEDIALNAKYAISVARKLGATVYLVWEHIRDVNPKFLLTFIASLKYVAESK